MKTSVERVDDTTVKLHVTVEPERVDTAIDEAARHVAQEVKIPGFRPGKAPRRVLERRLGKEVLLEEAIRHALPVLYHEAVHAEELEVVGNPEFDVETFVDGQEATFSATVEVRPDVAVPDYANLQIAHPEWELSDEEIDEQIDQLRERFAELDTVERPAQVGDHAVISVSVKRDGEVLEDVSQEDTLYEVRDPEESEQELDRQLVGAKAGDILTFADELGDDYGDRAGWEVEVTTIVKEVKAKRLPERDDDFAITASEFDTFDELRAGISEEVGKQKLQHARNALRGRVVEAVAEQVDVSIPKAMVSQEVQWRVNQIAQQAQSYGLDFDQFLQMTGQSGEDLVDQLTKQAEQTVKAQLVLDAVGRDAGVQVEQEDLETEIRRQAQRLGRSPEDLAAFMTAPERIGILVSDAFRRKTVDHLLATVQVLSAPPADAATEEELDEQDADEAGED